MHAGRSALGDQQRKIESKGEFNAFGLAGLVADSLSQRGALLGTPRRFPMFQSTCDRKGHLGTPLIFLGRRTGLEIFLLG